MGLGSNTVILYDAAGDVLVGQQVASASIPVTLASDQPAIATTSSPLNSTPNLSFGDIALSSVTTAAIRRTAYTEQSANFTGSIASASANDAAAGTGARTVRISYVDATGATAGTEDVTLNGTTGVNLVTTTKCFIEKIEVLTVGSGGSNAGIISLYTGAAKAGTVVGTIAAGDNRTFWCHHYVLSGQACNVTDMHHGNSSSVAGGTSVMVLRTQTLPVANQVDKNISDFLNVAGAGAGISFIYGSVIKVTGPARITGYVTTAAAASNTYRGAFNSYDQ